MSNIPRRITVVDIVLCVAVLAAGALFIPLAATSAPAVAVVYRDNRIVAEYPLSTPVEFTVTGGNGDVGLRIRDNAISVVSSRCPRQICRHAGSISRPFEQIICVPNHLLVELRSGGGREIDAIAR